MTADDKREWIAIIGDKRIPTSAAVVELYRRVFPNLPVRFELVEVEDPRKAPK